MRKTLDVIEDQDLAEEGEAEVQLSRRACKHYYTTHSLARALRSGRATGRPGCSIENSL